MIDADLAVARKAEARRLMARLLGRAGRRICCCSRRGSRADVFRPAYLQLQATRRRNLRRGVESSGARRADDAQGQAGVSRRDRRRSARAAASTRRAPPCSAGGRVSRAGWKASRSNSLSWPDRPRRAGARGARRRHGATRARLGGEARRFTLEASSGPFEVVRTYTVLGIDHILTGVDHLLFVLALMMIVRGRGGSSSRSPRSRSRNRSPWRCNAPGRARPRASG